MRQVVVVVVVLFSVLGQLLGQLRGGLRVHIHEDGSIASKTNINIHRHIYIYILPELDLNAADARKVRQALREALEFWRFRWFDSGESKI